MAKLGVFWQIGLKIFIGAQETIVYRLFPEFDFFGGVWRENRRGRLARVSGYGASKPNQKVGPLGGPFGSTDISKLFKICMP